MEKLAVFGNSGFVGSWITEYFLTSKKKYKIYGYSLKSETIPSLHKLLKHKERVFYQEYGNILNVKKTKKFLLRSNPDKIIYLISQSIVSVGVKDPYHTFLVNNIGLVNFLNIIKQSKLKSLSKIIIFTSDKVYLNLEKKTSFDEDDYLGGSDPYSASKACQEIISRSFFETYLKNRFTLVTLRAGNIIGGGDWSKDRIIPDIIKSNINKKTLKIRNINSIRPWQHILDVCNSVDLVLKKRRTNNKILSFNLGSNDKKKYSLKKILDFYIKNYDSLKIKHEKKLLKEKKYLSLNSNKFKKEYGYKNLLNFEVILKLTFDWYSQFYNKKNVIDLTRKQINIYRN